MRVNQHLFYSDDMQNLKKFFFVFSNIVSAFKQINAVAQKQTLKVVCCQLIFVQKICTVDICTENMYSSYLYRKCVQFIFVQKMCTVDICTENM